MDFDLVSNALRLVFDSPSVTFLGADIHEVECSNIVFTFSTSVAAYRLVLPHPEVIAKVCVCVCVCVCVPACVHVLDIFMYFA